MKVVFVACVALALTGCAKLATDAVHPAAKAKYKTQMTTTVPSHGFKQMTFEREDGRERVYYLSARKRAKGTLLYMHGNGITADRMLGELGFLKDHGLDVAVMEYSGYGPHKGRPSEGQMQKDVKGMVASLRKRQPELPILMVGSSLGGSLAITTVIETGVNGMVTIGAFSRTADLAPDWAGRIVSRRNAFDALGAATDVSVPWTILHCDGDRLIPAEMAQALYQARRNNVGADGVTRMVEECDEHEVPYPLWTKAIKSVIKQRAFRN
jgi:alpha-beta hydrolase superfamily lysophospholipase